MIAGFSLVTNPLRLTRIRGISITKSQERQRRASRGPVTTRSSAWGFFGGLMLALVAGGPCAGQPSNAGGEVQLLSFEGVVEVARAGSDQWVPAPAKQAFQPGDRLRTRENSRALLQSAAEGQWRMGESSEVTIVAAKTSGGHSILDLFRGFFYFFNRGKGLDLELQHRMASAATRGTDFAVTVGEDGRMEVAVFDGEVDLRNDLGLVTLSAGESGAVFPGRKPETTGRVDAVNVIQWCLYYPAVLDVGELELNGVEQQALNGSLKACRLGDVPAALRAYPENRLPGSDAERVYRAGLVLAAGQVARAEDLLRQVADKDRPADALRQLIAAVQFRVRERDREPMLASEWLAESYYRQSRASVEPGALEAARKAAQAAVRISPECGLAWARLAEMEFSFGRTAAALAALNRGLELAPRNANALAAKGFLLSAQNRIAPAIEAFNEAIQVDGSLANGWLGRGLCRIRQKQREAGQEDMLTAATLEPQRSVLRSYLGKALADAGKPARAEKELKLARELDPQDPTPWLYSALLNQQNNRINEAISDLETSIRLNDNRSLFRSSLLLDQDRAMRSANLASIYRDAGMADVGLREAARAVSYDYANPSAHLFIADSFNELRDPTRFNLRQETVWFNEYLLANLLAPVGAGRLSHKISEREYSRLFETDRVGLDNSTTAQTDGSVRQFTTQFGNLGNTAWSIDLDYQHNAGIRPNNELGRLELYQTVKQQITPADSALLLTKYQDYHSGDNFQYYNPSSARPQFNFDEQQNPMILGGYQHEWTPGVQTLFLGGRLSNAQQISDLQAPQFLLLESPLGLPEFTDSVPLDVEYRNQLEIYTGELNQIYQRERWTLVAGGRWQAGQFRTQSRMFNPPTGMADQFGHPPADQDLAEDFEHLSGYGYLTVRLWEPLSILGGVCYDSVTMPVNFRNPPITPGTETRSLVGPKAAVVWTPTPVATLRCAYAKSLAGVSLDESYRLEPAQLAGFPQAFRSIISESLTGSVAAPEYQTLGLALDLKPAGRTYAGLEAVLLQSDVRRTIGLFNLHDSQAPFRVDSTTEHLDYEERRLAASLYQLLGSGWVLGARYAVTRAELKTRLPSIPVDISPMADRVESADLHQLGIFALYNDPSGIFGRIETHWYHQTSGSYSPALPGDDFAQCNISVGYRFAHRKALIALGVLNLGNTGYHLNPLTSYSELPRERTFTAQFDFQF